MKHLLKLCLATAALALVPTAASADTPAQMWAKARVQDGLIAQLKKKDAKHDKYSREMPPPKARRVRVLSKTSVKDAHGRSFLTFEVEQKWGGSEWAKSLSGCVYKGSGNIYIGSGDQFRKAEFLWGKSAKVIPDVCVSPQRNDA